MSPATETVFLQVLLALCLGWAGGEKLRALDTFGESLAQLLPGVGAAGRRWAGLLLATLELSLAIALLAPVEGLASRAAALAAALLVAFSGLLAWKLYERVPFHCSCFGHARPVVWLDLVRNLLLVAAAVWLAALPSAALGSVFDLEVLTLLAGWAASALVVNLYRLEEAHDVTA